MTLESIRLQGILVTEAPGEPHPFFSAPRLIGAPLNRTEPQVHFAMREFDWCACKSCRARWVHENWQDKATKCGCRVCVDARTRRPLKAVKPASQPWEIAA